MTETGHEAIDLETPGLKPADVDHSAYLALVWGRHAGASIFQQVITPEERLVRTISRGGFPLMRQDQCRPTQILVTGSKGRHRL